MEMCSSHEGQCTYKEKLTGGPSPLCCATDGDMKTSWVQYKERGLSDMEKNNLHDVLMREVIDVEEGLI